jgi:hypothetical protein
VEGFIKESWELAAECDNFLIWFHSTDMACPGPNDGVDEEMRRSWEDFLDAVEQEVGRDFEITEAMARAFLSLRSQRLAEIRDDVQKAEVNASGKR